ncbi:MAG: ferrous iron transport protein B [Anaerolineaceae bacterium]|nr:ferrous iron transport protein B [Anaerolineaceae bacterium]
MRFALVGQPNCGKSTLFNQVAGYKAETGNFSGTTVSFKETKVRVLGEVVELVDLPGTYSLLGTNPAERVVLDYLVAKKVDAVINIIDATHLVQGLLLTLELMEMGRPIVLAVNMMDEASRQGLKIDGERLSELLGIPVLPMIATRGQGVREAFVQAWHNAKDKKIPQPLKYGKEIEHAVTDLKINMKQGAFPISRRAIAVKLLEGDPEITKQVENKNPGMMDVIQGHLDTLCHHSSRQAVWMIATERQKIARDLSQKISEQGEAQLSIRDKLDDFFLHPVFGYVFLLLVLGGFFALIYGIGNRLEAPMLNFFNNLTDFILTKINAEGLLPQLIAGAVQGISGGFAIVLPYLVPFLIGLGFLEDIGYLTRIAFLMDALMHRIGLHGKAIVPFILGYGCSIPAIMSTRIMENERDRFLSAALVTMIPCTARLSVIFGLVSFYLGPWAALGIYFFNILIIAITGRIISHFMPEHSPGLILEMPIYRMPTLRTVTAKAWFRIREFIVEAWPLLIIGSIILAALRYYSITPFLDKIFLPFTWALGLPAEVGTPLIFGIFRKELSLIMLAQALGTTNFASVLTPEQMISYTVFIVFYIPCIATMVTIKNELGAKRMWYIIGLSLFVAVITALIFRLIIFIL